MNITPLAVVFPILVNSIVYSIISPRSANSFDTALDDIMLALFTKVVTLLEFEVGPTTGGFIISTIYS